MKGLIVVCSVSLALLGVLYVAQGTAVAVQSDRERLQSDVRRQLAPLIGVFDNVTFSVEKDRTITLAGQVRDPNLKRHIEEDTRKVPGVRGVRSNIEVLPLSGSDDDLRLALYRAIYSQEGLQRYSVRINPPIHIVVNRGVVTLEGIVANRLEYTQANVAANGVFGAFSVKNNLQVENGA